MSSTTNTTRLTDYVLLDNAENATLTPLQRTPCLTPSECSAQSPILIPVANPTITTTTSNASTQSVSISSSAQPSYESFARALSLNQSNYYLESIVLAKRAGDEKAETESCTKARDVLGKLYPDENVNSIFFIRLAKYLRKHSKPEWAISALEEVDTGAGGKELPGLVGKEERITYWYYKALSILELETTDNGDVEEAIKNGMVEAVGSNDEEKRKTWVNVGYFLMSVYFILKEDEVDARFWKNQLPEEWTAPDGIYSQHGQIFNQITTGDELGVNTPRPTDQMRRYVSQLEDLTTQDILVRDVARLKRDMHEVFDTVYVNYKEMHERIKAIHGIIDGREKVEGGDLEDLKRRLGYLEGMVLRA